MFSLSSLSRGSLDFHTPDASFSSLHGPHASHAKWVQIMPQDTWGHEHLETIWFDFPIQAACPRSETGVDPPIVTRGNPWKGGRLICPIGEMNGGHGEAESRLQKVGCGPLPPPAPWLHTPSPPSYCACSKGSKEFVACWGCVNTSQSFGLQSYSTTTTLNSWKGPRILPP